MEQGEYGGSEQPGSSDIGQSPALRMIGNGTIEQMVLDNFRQEMKQLIRNAVQAVEVAVRKVVQAELQKFEEKLSTGWTRNDSPNERRLKLKFEGEVPRIVHTGEELIDLKVALFDASEHIVTNGCESSARVEIVLLDASSKDDGNSITPQNFDGRIISAGDKTKPHFAKNVYIHLDKGVGTLSGLKLGHGEDWTKSYNCRLGAMIARKFAAQEAWTVPFKVKDKRLRHNEKHDTPYPSSKVCRLKGIGRDGKPFSRLTENNIKTVLDFRFWLSVNPNRLQKEILRTGDCKWNIIVAHARECKIDDKKVYAHKSLTEPQTHVFYDAVGELKGLIEDETNYIPMNNLVADKKERARELLASVLEPSAFAQRYNTSFEDEASLLQQFPSISSEIDASSNSQSQQSLSGNNVTLPRTPTDPDYDKRETPTLSDDVSRLFNICKDGQVHKCLRDNNISTVEDFLIRLLRDHEGLKRIVNLESLEWEATVSDARACQPGTRMYCYTNLEEKTSVIFNVVGNILGLCFENHFVPTRSLPEKLLRGDAQGLLARARENWRSVNPVDDMNHLQLHLSAGGNQMSSADCEMVGESSIGPAETAFLSTSSRMEPCGETQDFGCSSSAIDHHMETVIDVETRDDATWQCSHGDLLDLECFGDVIKKYFPGLYAESQLVSNRWKWEQLLCVIRCRFSMRRMRCDSRKRQRQR